MTLSPVEEDGRAQRVATTAASAGWDVTLLGLGSEADTVESRLGDVTVLQVPVVAGKHPAPPEPVLAPPSLAYRSRAEGVRAGQLLRVDKREAQVRVARAQLAQRRLADVVPVGLRPVTRVGASVVVRALRARQAGRAGLHQLRWRALQKRSAAPTDTASDRPPAWQVACVDADLRLGPVLERLRPDVVDAQGELALLVASRAVVRLRAAGAPTVLVHGARAHAPAAGGDVAARSLREAELAVTREVDAVTAPTREVLDEVRRRTPGVPAVLLTDGLDPGDAVAAAGASGPEAAEDLARAVGVQTPAQLVVHLGPVRSEATLAVVADALAATPGAHLCLLACPSGPATRALRVRAGRSLGGDRFHVLDVPRSEALRLLAGASAGVVHADPAPGSGAAPATGYPELVAAGVPVLTDLRSSTGALVLRDGTGEVVELDSTTSTTRALGRLLTAPERYRDNAWTARDRVRWDGAPLTALYAEVAGRSPEPAQPAPSPAPVVLQRVTPVPERRVLGVGPANFAGQGWAWAKAAEAAVPGLRTEVFAVDQGVLNFEADRRITRRQLRSVAWQLEQQARVLNGFTHLLAEANRPVFGFLNGDDLSGDLTALTRAGLRVGLVMHGSDVRDPYRHRDLVPDSPFHGDDEYVAAVAAFTARTQSVLADFAGPVMVATPDLLDDVPHGIWLPVVIDVERWASTDPVMQREVPLVVHVPSKARLKGSAAIEEVLRGLELDGLVEYRRLTAVPPDKMPEVIAEADVVLDQFALGSYGVLACEAMAAGRVVVGHVRDEVRARTGAALPVVEATTATLSEVLLGLLADRDGARAAAVQGPRFVRRFHDGTMSGMVLREHLLDEPAA